MLRNQSTSVPVPSGDRHPERGSYLDSINRRWPCGTRIYDYKLPKETSTIFDSLDESKRHLIEHIFNTRSLCTVGTYKMNAGMRGVPIVYFIDVDDTLQIQETIRSHLNEYSTSCPEIEEDDLTGVMAIFDEKGNLFKDMDYERYKSISHFITSCELANLILLEMSELSVVRWSLESIDPEEFSVHLKLEDTKEVCEILGIEASLELLEDFHFSAMN